MKAAALRELAAASRRFDDFVRELARCFARAAVDALLKAEREAPEQQAEPAPTKSKKTQE